jgi:hypothetical protein
VAVVVAVTRVVVAVPEVIELVRALPVVVLVPNLGFLVLELTL